MKASLAFLALTLATFTSALPYPSTSTIERRGGGGEPYAPKGGRWDPNPYIHNQDGSGHDHGEQNPPLAPRHGHDGDNDQAPEGFSQTQWDNQMFWDSIGNNGGSGGGKTKRSPAPHHGQDGDNDKAPEGFSQDQWDNQMFWDSIGNNGGSGGGKKH